MQTEIAARLAEIKEKIRGAAPRDPELDLWTDTRWLIEQLGAAQKQAGAQEEYVARLKARLARVTEVGEQQDIQLAGCSVAALGGTRKPAQRGDYGWSSAYQDVLELRREKDRLAEENERLRHTLNRLTNEASGFLSMADRNVHGFTNAAILRDRIQEAREISSGGRPEGDSLE